jgi:3'-phosphoadenosine 5'-phosphosulfate sulfotransferase (PAPS reductase)/FAD synthetase
MEISEKELKKRLNWTLNQKIDHSLYVIDAFIAQYPNSVISFSGGLDSTVLLYLTRIIDKNKEGCFVNTTNEFSEIIKFVKSIENVKIIHPKITFVDVVQKYGFPLISKEISQFIWEIKHTKSDKLRNLRMAQLPDKWKYLLDAEFDICHKCCYFLKKYPFNKINKNGMLVGTLATESRLRKLTYLKTGCINLNKKQVTPLSIWTKQDIWRFIRENNIPYCDIYNKGEKTTGCAYCGFGIQFDQSRFYRLKQREPKRFNIMMNIENNGVKYKDAIRMVFEGTLNLKKRLFEEV